MKPINLLRDSHPNLFPESFYFECGEGWYTILYLLLHRIEKHQENIRAQNAYRVRHGRDPIKYKSVKIVQIKEKWGGLRFYYYGGDEYVKGAVAMAEEMSYYTCEACGDPGSINTSGWYRVRCYKCREKEPQSL